MKGVYRHFKGNIYFVRGVATHTETKERLVVYYDLRKPDDIWVRPVSMFIEEVEHEGKRVPRFQKLQDPKDDDADSG